MAVEAHRFFVPVGVVALPTAPSAPIEPGETYFDTTLGFLQTWDGTKWVSGGSGGGATGPRGPIGPEGPPGPTGTAGASTDPGNAVIIDASGNIYVPDEVIIAAGPTGPLGDTLEIWIDPNATGQVFDAYSRAEADAAFVNVSGDTMTGPLYLAGDPTGPTEAATKNYVDTNAGGGGGGGSNIVYCATQAEYDAIVTKDPSTLYCIGI